MDQPKTPNHVWGAIPASNGGWDFAIWLPSAREVDLHLDGRVHPLEKDASGTFRGQFSAPEWAEYSYKVDGFELADPASRWQKDRLMGPSRLLDPRSLTGPKGPQRPLDQAVISELHIGSFTPQGTFRAAAESAQLARLADLGITMIELMPIGHFPGQRGWGYDCILPWAPHPAYGSPTDLRALVDQAHHLGLQVCLDLVFNHFGPEGCGLFQACPEFFHDHSNDWGRAIDFSRPEVREFFVGCAIWWLEAYGIDALRFDAVHALEADDPGFAAFLSQQIRAHDFGREVHLIAEDNRNVVAPYLPESGQFHAVWNDDYHHAQHVVLTGEVFGYYKDFADDPLQDMARALRSGYALQGQPRSSGQVKGEPSTALQPQNLVAFNLNHDHAGNRPQGKRLVSLVGTEKAMVAHALLLTSPSIPLLFMGEEIGSDAPFPWFADYEGELAEAMRRDRLALFEEGELSEGPMLDPFDPELLINACPYRSEPEEAERWQDLTRDLLALRSRLLPIWRSGRAALPEIKTAPPSALSVEFHYHAGRITIVSCFDPEDRIAGAMRPDPVFQIGSPDQPPFFAIWLDLLDPGSGSESETSIAYSQAKLRAEG